MQTTTHKDLQDSGLHNKLFYTTRYFDRGFYEVTWNEKLHKKYSIDEDELTDLSKNEVYDYVNNNFYEAIEIYKYYRQVSKYNYNEKNAYKSDLFHLNILIATKVKTYTY
jgi:hypothetical protein